MVVVWVLCLMKCDGWLLGVVGDCFVCVVCGLGWWVYSVFGVVGCVDYDNYVVESDV